MTSAIAEHRSSGAPAGSVLARDGVGALLRAEDLVTRYGNGALGLQGVSITVHENEVLAIIGPNGAGKTTLLRSLTGFLRAEGARVVSGRVLLAGADITGREPHDNAIDGVVLVPDRNKVFQNLSVEANFLAIGKTHARARHAQLLDWVLSLFPALKPMLARPAGSLSGGQQQMVAIARGLMCEPRVLLLDEMTLGLHPSLRKPLFELLPTMARDGRAVVVVDESIDLALATAGYGYVLGRGVVMAEGAAHTLTPERIAQAYVGERDTRSGAAAAPPAA